MVSAPLRTLDRPCLLWQIDADELWRTQQITAVRRLFLEQPQRSAAFFWCDYFVGPEAVVVTRYNYTQDPRYEWLRVWRYQPGDRWRCHEPPTLVRWAEDGTVVDVADLAPFGHDETEDVDAVFQHYAYATETQLRHRELLRPGYGGLPMAATPGGDRPIAPTTRFLSLGPGRRSRGHSFACRRRPARPSRSGEWWLVLHRHGGAAEPGRPSGW